MSVFRLGYERADSAVKRDPRGDSLFDATISSVGVFPYRNADGSVRMELRAPEDVFDPKSLETIPMLPVTRGHPASMRVDQADPSPRVGTVNPGYRLRQAEGLIDAQLHIHADQVAELIATGRESAISPGYRCDLDGTPGEWQGIKYDARQTNIRYNHIAIVPRGRQGGKVAIHLDSVDGESFAVQEQSADNAPKKENTMTEQKVRVIRIDAIDVELPIDVADKILSAVNSLVAKHETALSEAKSSLEKATARADVLDEQLKVATNPAKLNAQIQARTALIATVSRLTGDQADVNLSERALKEKVVAKANPKLDLTGKTDDYVSAAFDMATISLSEKRNDGVDQMGRAFTPRRGVKIDLGADDNAARQAMIEKLEKLSKE